MDAASRQQRVCQLLMACNGVMSLISLRGKWGVQTSYRPYVLHLSYFWIRNIACVSGLHRKHMPFPLDLPGAVSEPEEPDLHSTSLRWFVKAQAMFAYVANFISDPFTSRRLNYARDMWNCAAKFEPLIALTKYFKKTNLCNDNGNRERFNQNKMRSVRRHGESDGRTYS